VPGGCQFLSVEQAMMHGKTMLFDDRDARNPAKWPGLNLLGFALMEVRKRIR